MKSIFFLMVATMIIFFGCTKKNVQSTSAQTPNPKTLVANTGLDTTICMPYGGTGNVFKSILDGRASHDGSGNIVSYTWTESGPDFLYPDGQQVNLSKDSTAVTFFGPGYHRFNLEIRDDHGRIDSNQITFNIISLFSNEYDALSWDSTIGSLTTISVKFKPGLIETWPDTVLGGSIEAGYLISYTGAYNSISKWELVPYEPYNSIQLVTQPLFYSLISGSLFGSHPTLYPEVFAKTNSGIDFNQKVSIGFNISSAGDWDYSSELI
jgi:hypothetical protein